ncbi:MAG: hypothetical protein MK108_03535 [Mariniblastus sp.]|nr:hypothetical protein [Mariniblastus sp.]
MIKSAAISFRASKLPYDREREFFRLDVRRFGARLFAARRFDDIENPFPMVSQKKIAGRPLRQTESEGLREKHEKRARQVFW